MNKTTIEEYDENGKLIKKTIIDTDDENIHYMCDKPWWWYQNIPYYFTPWCNDITSKNLDLNKLYKSSTTTNTIN
jgi:hypothetical protein